jgi:hypothetical protein
LVTSEIMAGKTVAADMPSTPWPVAFHWFSEKIVCLIVLTTGGGFFFRGRRRGLIRPALVVRPA